MTSPIRLDKRVAELLACSRADAQKYVEGGWVSVDGEINEECQTQVTGERVEVERRHAFTEGTWFPTVRVTATRDGDRSSPYARLQNLARARVVVSSGEPPG